MMLQTAAETDDLAAVVSEGAGPRSLTEELDQRGGFEQVTAGIPATQTASLAVFSNHCRRPT